MEDFLKCLKKEIFIYSLLINKKCSKNRMDRYMNDNSEANELYRDETKEVTKEEIKNEIDEKIKEETKEEIDIYKIFNISGIETIYIGGGTPGLMTPKQLSDLMGLIKKEFGSPITGEITMEANPFSLTEEKLSGYREAGVNRLSLGVQSFHDKELKFLGRKHTAAEAVEKISLTDKYFDNYNIDLIFAVPGQSIVDWRYTLEKAIDMNPNHISLYNLQIEENTPLAFALHEGEFEEVDDRIDAGMYLLARELLEESGYSQYEISNFAREGYQSRHNRIYWELKPYLGLGPAAHGFTGSIRYNNYTEVHRYQETFSKVLDRIIQSKTNKSLDEPFPEKMPIENIIKLSKEDLMAEKLFMGLRLLEGVSLKEFYSEYGTRLEEYYTEEIRKLKSMDLIEISEGRLKLTEKGLLHGNRVFMEFLPV